MNDATARQQPELTPLEALTVEHGLPAVALEYFSPSDAIKLVPLELCRRLKVLPLSRVGSVLTVVMSHQDLAAIDALRFFTSGLCIEVVVAPAEDLKQAIQRFYNVQLPRVIEQSNLVADVELEVKARSYGEEAADAFDQRINALIASAMNSSHVRKHVALRSNVHRAFYVGSIDGPTDYTAAIESALKAVGK
jgi:Type II secretion system (T2SS), protein E, N-terminal domain